MEKFQAPTGETPHPRKLKKFFLRLFISWMILFQGQRVGMRAKMPPRHLQFSPQTHSREIRAAQLSPLHPTPSPDCCGDV